MNDETDRRDARLLASGRLDELFATYRPVLWARARLRGLTATEADDVVQNAMLRALTTLQDGGADHIPIRVRLHMCLKWCVGDHRVAARRHRSLPLGNWDAEVPDGVDAILERDHLEQLFSGLPPRERDICRLHYLEDKTPRDIAGILGMTRNAVDQALHRARRRLEPHLR
ncbi:MAG: sigma-70 family RNA polymerase sigma factor [Actinomycetota bacterium]